MIFMIKYYPLITPEYFRMSISLYTAAISTAFDLEANILFCSIFRSEKDAMESVLKFALKEDLISQSRYIEMIKEEEYEKDYIETISKMNRDEFEKMICDEFRVMDQTTYNLKMICRTYDKDYSLRHWDFLILKSVSLSM